MTEWNELQIEGKNVENKGEYKVSGELGRL